MVGDGISTSGRQRIRVGTGSPMSTSGSPGSLTTLAVQQLDPCSSPRAKVQSPVQQPQVTMLHGSPQGVSLRTIPVMHIQTEATASCGRAPTPPAAPAQYQQQSSHSIPDLPAPRSWTPSKLCNSSTGGGSASTPRSITPAEALEQEMQELCRADPGRPAAPAGQQRRPHSSTDVSSSGGMGSPVGGYKSAYYNAGYIETRVEGGMRRPASTGTSMPYLAQHNNLVGLSPPGSKPSSSSDTEARDASWSPLGLSTLKEKMTGRSTDCSSTAVEAFSQPLPAGPVLSDGGSPVVVARRRGTAPGRMLPSGVGHSSRSAAQWEQECMILLGAGDRLAALQLPGPSNGVVRCYIKRTKGLLGLAPVCELRLESSDEVLAVAHHSLKVTGSCFHISLGSSSCGSGSGCSTPSSSPSLHGGSGDSSTSGRDEQELVAKLKANMLGTEYLLRARGGSQASHKGFNAQLLAVNHKPTINHVQAAPRTMTAVLPVPESQAWQGGGEISGQYDSLTACMEAARERQLPLSYERDLVMLHTMQPHFDTVKQVHYLDFKGRVTEVSSKNCQLVHWDHNSNRLGTDLVLLFGKKGHGEYALDFSYPMTPLQAFALGLSSIDTKLCYAL